MIVDNLNLVFRITFLNNGETFTKDFNVKIIKTQKFHFSLDSLKTFTNQVEHDLVLNWVLLIDVK